VIGECLQAVERNAERQRRVEVTAGMAHVADQKIAIFEIADESDVENRGGGDAPAPGRKSRLDQPIDGDGRQKNRGVERTGNRVEDKTGNDQRLRSPGHDGHATDADRQQDSV
jgi:hypothetical protein